VDADVGKQLEPECAIELREVRRSLLEDYHISPAVAENCANDVKTHCDKEERRDVIHCLMDIARHQYRAAAPDNAPHYDDNDSPAKHKRLSDGCYSEVCVSLKSYVLICHRNQSCTSQV